MVSRLLNELAANAAPGTYDPAVLEPRVTCPVPDRVPVHVLGGAPRLPLAPPSALAAALLQLVMLVRRKRPETIVSFMPRSNALNLLGGRFTQRWPRAAVSERVSIDLNCRGVKRALHSLTYPAIFIAVAVLIAAPGEPDLGSSMRHKVVMYVPSVFLFSAEALARFVPEAPRRRTSIRIRGRKVSHVA